MQLSAPAFVAPLPHMSQQLADFPMPSHGGHGDPAWDAMYSAVYNATPGSLSSGQNELITDAGIRGHADPSAVGDLVRAAYNATPSNFGSSQNTLVLGAAALSSHPDVGGVVRSVYNATPGNFGADQNAAVIAAALLARSSASDAATTVRDVYNHTPASYTPQDNASAMLGQLFAKGDRGAEWNYRWLVSEVGQVS